MKKFALIISGFIALAVIGSISMKVDYMKPEKQRISGIVTYIEWESRNHGMPFIEIKRENGHVQRFHSSRILLNENNLKVGDKFRKEPNSKMCSINEVEIECLR